MPAACLHAYVSGRVQGVAFRWHTRARAEELGLAGWVRNLADGRVEVWAEGEEAAVGALRAWLETGPPASRVERVELRPAAPSGAEGFGIAATARG